MVDFIHYLYIVIPGQIALVARLHTSSKLIGVSSCGNIGCDLTTVAVPTIDLGNLVTRLLWWTNLRGGLYGDRLLLTTFIRYSQIEHLRTSPLPQSRGVRNIDSQLGQ